MRPHSPHMLRAGPGLTVTGCPALKELPQGVEFLRNLAALHLESTSDDFLEKFQSEEEWEVHLSKISHIKKVYVGFSGNE